MGDEQKAANAKRRAAGRSPAYPSFPVDKALEQITALRALEGDYAVPVASAVKAWGYGEKSSGGRQALATLKYYGLIDVSGDGDARRVKVSDIARRILLDEREDDTEKRRLIREVALAPSVHRKLHDEYPKGLASDGSVQHFLIFNLGFNEDAARDVLAEFKITAEYAGLYRNQNDVDKNVDVDEGGGVDWKLPPIADPISVGDQVQWTSGGVDQFPKLATVLGFSSDGQWVFTDQGKSAVPKNEVTVVKKVSDDSMNAPPQIPREMLRSYLESQGAGRKEHEVLTSGKLKSGSFEVRVVGEVTAADIRRIRTMLKAQEEILGDEEESEHNAADD